MILIIGALFGLISVAFGAFAEHGLRENVTDEQFRFLMTAVRYNQINAVIIVSIGLTILTDSKIGNLSFLKWSSMLFIIGTVLFSFSIYLSVSLKIPSLTNLAPIGGTTLMIAWLLLLVSGFVAKSALLRKKY